MSATAIAQSSPARPIAASQFADADSSNVSSVSVPGRDEADDRAIDQRLRPSRLARLRRALGLLGNRDAVPGLDQPRKIRLRRMDRDPAHRDRLALVLAALGERDVEARGCDLRILEEQLEEVAHPVEQQRVPRLILEAPVLGHHRGWSVGAGHG
jgi:hypothetical protein